MICKMRLNAKMQIDAYPLGKYFSRKHKKNCTVRKTVHRPLQWPQEAAHSLGVTPYCSLKHLAK